MGDAGHCPGQDAGQRPALLGKSRIFKPFTGSVRKHRNRYARLVQYRLRPFTRFTRSAH